MLYLPQQPTASEELCSFCALHRTFYKGLEGALCCLLKHAASCLFMGDSSAPGVGQEGLATPTVLGIDHPLVVSLLNEFTNIFCDPIFPLDIHFTHDLDLIDPAS